MGILSEMIYASLVINIIILVPVCLGLILFERKMAAVFGERTTGREILLCIYLTILAASIFLMFHSAAYVEYVKALLSAQIVYKSLSVFIIRDKKNPVLWFNFFIAIFHSAALAISR